MTTPVFVAIGIALVVALTALAVAWASSRQVGRTRVDLAASHAEVEALRARVDALGGSLAAARASLSEPAATGLPGSAGLPPAKSDGGPNNGDSTSPRVSVTLGEPLLKAFAFGYAVRQALSPRTRNRIAFEMRQEVRRSRRQRRRDLRAARRLADVGRKDNEVAA